MTSPLALLAKAPLWAWALLIAIGVIGWQRAEVGHYKAKIAAVTTKHAVEAQHVAELATKASEAARNAEHRQAQAFDAITTDYIQATTHAHPSLAGALPAAIAAGTVRLQNDCPETHSSSLSEAAARSRAADAAATQALANRVQAAIAAVQAGDEADARERQLGAQIRGLQAVLRAERE